MPIRRLPRLFFSFASAMIPALLCASCAFRPPEPEAPVGYPFSPVSIRVHPLTQFDRDPAGQPTLICHVELFDAWGDAVKGVGQLRLQLFGGLDTPSIEQARWEVDLADLKTNARVFDRATRTYRVSLVELPPWTHQWMEHAESNPGSDPRSRVTVRATFSPTDEEQESLADDFVIEP